MDSEVISNLERLVQKIYDCDVEQDENNPGLPGDVDEKLETAAHHEAGHLVIAAAEGLRLRPEGLSVDPRGEGLACYCKQPDGSDISRKRIIASTLAGFCAEDRFCEERSYLPRDPACSCDWVEAGELLCALSTENLLNGNVHETWKQLLSRSEQLVEQHWLSIKALATALLAKDWEPLKPLKSGGVWSHEIVAKYVVGYEVVRILARSGISAVCEPDC